MAKIFTANLAQYYPRWRVGQTLNERVDRWIHPLTRVVLTTFRVGITSSPPGIKRERFG
jgi:hypothetical protein